MQKPKHTASILTIKANEDVPEALLLKLCQENQSALGLLVRDGSKIDYEKFGIGELKMDETPEETYAFIKGILRAQRKKPRMLVFHSLPAEFDEDEVQPWFLKDAKNNPVLGIAFEGDFPGRDTDGSSEMFGLMHEYLGPKIDEVYNFCGKQINKTINWLKGDSFANDLKNTYSHRAQFVFFPNEGEPFIHGKNEIGINAGWGTCSNTYGYTESVLEAGTVEEAEPAPKKSKFGGDDEPAPVIKTDDKGIHTLPEKPKEEVIVPQQPKEVVTDPIVKVALETAEGHWETPPATLHGKDLKRWYRSIYAQMGEMDLQGKTGRLPEDWDKRPRIFVKVKTVVKSLDQLASTAIGSTVSETAHPALPVISGSDQAKITEFIKKFTSNRVVESPLELQKQESQLALFSELCLKGGLKEIYTWPTAMINALCKTHPEAAWLLIIELRRKNVQLEESLSVGNKTLGELTGTEKPVHTPATAPASVPSTPSKVEHAPKKTSKYA